MARLSINEVTTYRWSFEEDVTRYAAAEIPAMGVWRRKLADFGEEKGIELLRDSGLAVSNVGWAGGFTGSDGRSFRESIEDALEAIRLSGALGASSLVVYTGARGGHTHNHARRLMVEALRELAPVAAAHRVSLALEPMHPGCAGEWTFLHTLADAVELANKVGSPQVGVVFDTYHLGHDPKVLEQIAPLASRIRVVHLGDGAAPPDKEQDRTRLGEGRIPLAAIVGALAAAGYDGDYDVELIGDEISATDYSDLLEQSKRAFNDLLAEACVARSSS